MVELGHMESPVSSLTFASVSRIITPAIGALWLAVLEFIIVRPRPGLIAAAIVLAIVLTLVLRWPLADRPRMMQAGLVLLTSLATISVLGIVVGQMGQQVVALLGAIMVGVTFWQSEDVLQGVQHRGRAILSLVTADIFFGWVSILTIGIILTWPWWLTILFGLALTVAAAILAWTDAGMTMRFITKRLPFVAIIGTEIMAVTWWLPTNPIVGAIIATTLIMVTLQIFRHLWQSTWEAGRGRRYILVSTSIIALIILTARWV